MREIRPMADMGHRIPEQGRIRIGVKGPKGHPQRLDRFRFTSADVEAVQTLAGVYGGQARPWPDPKHQGHWEVITDAAEIRVVLPPDPLSGTPIYECWSGGGLLRRCDGEVALVPQGSAEGTELAEVPCICAVRGALECKPKTRLNVILPDVRFGGTWRLETGGWNAAEELPGMVDTILTLQDQGFVVARLGLTTRTKVRNGKTNHFVVPYLTVDQTPEALLRGEGRLSGLAPAPEPVAIEAAPEPVEPEPNPEPDPAVAKAQRKFFAMLHKAGLDPAAREGLYQWTSGGRAHHFKDLTKDEIDRLYAGIQKVIDGEVEAPEAWRASA